MLLQHPPWRGIQHAPSLSLATCYCRKWAAGLLGAHLVALQLGLQACGARLHGGRARVSGICSGLEALLLGLCAPAQLCQSGLRLLGLLGGPACKADATLVGVNFKAQLGSHNSLHCQLSGECFEVVLFREYTCSTRPPAMDGAGLHPKTYEKVRDEACSRACTVQCTPMYSRQRRSRLHACRASS